MPSVHIIGQVLGASGFTEDKLFCKYKVVYDHKSMRLIDGDPEDQTQLASASVCVYPPTLRHCSTHTHTHTHTLTQLSRVSFVFFYISASSLFEFCLLYFQAIGHSHSFSHPVDLHFGCTALEGWPKVSVEVWSQDQFGRNVLAGYGCCYVPTSPGMHHIDCVTWLPAGSLWDRLKATFLGTSPSLNHPEIAYSDIDRLELNTCTAGTIHLDLQILLLDFRHRGVEFVSETNKNADLRLLGARAVDKLHAEDRTADIGRYLAS